MRQISVTGTVIGGTIGLWFILLKLSDDPDTFTWVRGTAAILLHALVGSQLGRFPRSSAGAALALGPGVALIGLIQLLIEVAVLPESELRQNAGILAPLGILVLAVAVPVAGLLSLLLAAFSFVVSKDQRWLLPYLSYLLLMLTIGGALYLDFTAP